MAEPFYLYIRRKGGNYYVQFRLEDGSLTVGKSTGTPNYVEAQKIAMREYSTGEYKCPLVTVHVSLYIIPVYFPWNYVKYVKSLFS